MKPLFSLKNLIKPQYRKSHKKDVVPGANDTSKKLFESNTNADKVYKTFIQNILNIYSQNKLINDDKNISKLTYLYGKENIFMMNIQEEIQRVLSEYEKIYILKLGLSPELSPKTQDLSITQAIKYMWDNKKDDNFLNTIQNHTLISVSQNMSKSTCKLHIHTDEFNYFMKKAIEQMIRNPKRRLQILTNTFKTYNPDDPYI